MSEDVLVLGSGSKKFVRLIADNSYLKFNKIKFKNLKSITMAAFYRSDYHYNGTVEIREDSPTGKIIGQAELNYYDKTNSVTKYHNIPIEPTKEKGSLCLVFKNPKDENQYITNGVNWILLNYKR